MSFTPFRFPSRALAPRKILLLAGPMLAGLGLVAALPRASRRTRPGAGGHAPIRAFSPEQKRAIEEIVKDYLIANPEVFLEVQQSLEAKMEQIQAERIKAAIAQNARDIYHSADAPVAGNPKGDIAMVEFFDYNCGYCKRGFPELAKLIDKDPKVRVVLKELPILSKGSKKLRVALAARCRGNTGRCTVALLDPRAQPTRPSRSRLRKSSASTWPNWKDMDFPRSKPRSNGCVNSPTRWASTARRTSCWRPRHRGAPEDLYEQLAKNVAELRQSGCAVC